MSDFIEVYALVEGKTEQLFIEKILAPYLGCKEIYMHAQQCSKPGQKGGDVRFSRVKGDLGIHLKQRPDTYVTTLIDYYGTKEWPGLDDVPAQAPPAVIAQTINEATKLEVFSLFAAQQVERRFIPFVAVHEFEALLFSDAAILAKYLGKDVSVVSKVISACGSPEAINNSPQTAPSKRLDDWCGTRKFLKTTTGISVAEEIGIDKIRQKCPLFDSWLATFEKIQRGD
ncbi:conserved hypothetical protein [Magnetococcus marinus MC-1]|uniref:DUF4276 domain-containing protein n=1 Tax=Magnetococcus marinus (strain ATCC BAA-1437 / JCM 17883 / MC-1) TaxID=156889 RepID=A0L7Z4_MAGMM|nr:DUF4276 family protein [Magnetococcus marinus]ABK44087.1 conserved hypothetical protein [Magnetococcus marinus MC-1]